MVLADSVHLQRVTRAEYDQLFFADPDSVTGKNFLLGDALAIDKGAGLASVVAQDSVIVLTYNAGVMGLCTGYNYRAILCRAERDIFFGDPMRFTGLAF